MTVMRPAADPGVIAGVIANVTRDEGALRAFLRGLPGVDQVGTEQRAAVLWSRSIKHESKACRCPRGW
jgi:deoxyribose-phosphate aldolase